MELYRMNINSLLSDRKGSKLSSGGDVEICYMILLMGYEVWYDKRLTFYHRIEMDRLKWPYYLKLKQGITHSFPVTFVYLYFIKNGARDIRSFILYYARAFRSHLRRMKRRDPDPERDEVNKLVNSIIFRYFLKPWIIL